MSDESELWNYVKDFATAPPTLPLIHSTDLFSFRKIQRLGELKPASDSVYPGENLIYFFYGRPSYRVNPDVQTTEASYFAPICLVFGNSLLRAAHRISPFDSGAHASGRMRHAIHKDMGLSDFQLQACADAPSKLISAFYDSERNYLDCRPKIDRAEMDRLQKEGKSIVEAYVNLITQIPNSGSDDRLSSIEVQINSPVNIANNVQAVVLPYRFFAKEVVKEIETSWNAKVIPYSPPAVYNPSEQMGVIFEKVRDFLASEYKDHA